jgi:hypothetical protein
VQADHAARRARAAELRTKARRITGRVVQKRLTGETDGIAELEAEARRLNVEAAEIDPDAHDLGIGLATSPASQAFERKLRRNR